jgi:NAD(P)-dependent dehydrogenase (short-subunit alcohol dehydrogenase family)
MNTAARDAPQATAQGIPAGRLGTAEDIAGAVVYLASRAGDYVVGQTLVVDGGLSLSR